MSITYQKESDIAHLILDDGKANALSFEFLAELNDHIGKAEAEAKAILISGRPGRFCAGFDLSIMRENPDRARELVIEGGRLCLRLVSNRRPIVMACTGHAIAAGALMLLSGDTRIGIEGDFKIGLNETAIGMVLPPYGIDLPKARLNPTALSEATIQGHLYSPQEAVMAGFLDKTVVPELLMETAMQAAHQLAALPGAAYYGNKRQIRAGLIKKMTADLT